VETRLKVFAYITLEGRLLVYRHTQSPDAGIQVPGGSVEGGESLEAAVLREAEEETGLQGLRIDEYLGECLADARQWGIDSQHIRHFFHLEPGPHTFPGGVAPDSWLYYERTPSDGSPGPIEFEFFWVGRDKNPPHAFMVELGWELGTMLTELD